MKKLFRNLLLPAAVILVLGGIFSGPAALASDHHAFDQWRAGHFTSAELLDEEVSGPHAAPAGDGLSNLAKYVFGLDPWTPARGALPKVIWDLEGPALRFTALVERPGVELLLGVSTDLLQWDSILLDGNYAHWGSVALGDGREEITASPAAASDAKQFLRLEIRLVDSGVQDALMGLWHMDEVAWGGGTDRCGNARDAILDESGHERHLILGNRPGSCDTPPESWRVPSLIARDGGSALSFDGSDDVAYVRDLWSDPAEQNYRLTFDFNPNNPLGGDQTVMITTDFVEVRLMQNSAGTHARLRLFRWPTGATTGVAASHWFYQQGASLDTWHSVEVIVQNGQMEIRVDGTDGSVATYDETQLATPHHNAHYLGQTWSGGRSFSGSIDNFRVESIATP